ncbi:DUF1353 domain-containing protein [Pseudooceanicola sp. 502str34]
MSQYTGAKSWCLPIGRGLYLTTEPLVWHVGKLDSECAVMVPWGFQFDVTIPRLWCWLFDPNAPEYLKAAALHDWLLEEGWDRLSAGAVFHNALKADGVTVWRRLIMWLAVSLYHYN